MSVSADPTLVPQTSLGSRAGRLVWGMVWALLYRPSPRPCHAWRAMLLRAFGAKAGAHCHFYPGSKVWAPWNLRCEDRVTLADGAEVYNPSPIDFGSHAIVSQGAYVCGATHLYNELEFRMVSYPMRIGAYAWICARAIVGPGVNVGEGAVLGLGSVATKDLEAFGVYVGSPAKKVKERERTAVGVKEKAGPSTAFGAKNAPNFAQDDN
ncbi:MAG: putative colanic acid biosynthesis acetyltransferase [Acidobacteriaceae bacterium]